MRLFIASIMLVFVLSVPSVASAQCYGGGVGGNVVVHDAFGRAVVVRDGFGERVAVFDNFNPNLNFLIVPRFNSSVAIVNDRGLFVRREVIVEHDRFGRRVEVIHGRR